MTIATLARTGLAAAAGALALSAGAAAAQGYAPAAYDEDGYYTAPELTVIAPRELGRSSIGAPVRIVRESRAVYTADLDLTTGWGAHALKVRIENAARDACADLDARYPITDERSGDCFRSAVRNAMYQVEDALGFAPPYWPDLG